MMVSRTEFSQPLIAEKLLMTENKIRPFLSLAILVGFLFSSSAIADEQTRREIDKQTRQATVLIVTENGQGSGFYVRKDLIATNYHVIEDARNRPGAIKYKREGQQRFTPVKSVLGYDQLRDLAILEVSTSRVSPLVLGDSNSVQPPDTVYVAGYPKSLRLADYLKSRAKVTTSIGNISAIHKSPLNRWLQFTAPISGGSSGGPVLNSQGEVIGVATWIIRSTGEIDTEAMFRKIFEDPAIDIKVDDVQNLNFAISTNHLKALLKKHGIELPPRPKPVDPKEEERREAERVKAKIIKQLKAATVHIIRSDPNGHELPLMSGFFVSPDQIATDFHVVYGSTLKRVRRLGRGTTSDDLLLAEQPPKTDKKHHLAILKIEKADVGSLSLGNSDDVGIGGEIYLVGDPASGEVSEGKISDILEKDGVRYFEFDAQVSPGSSGGPIVNTKGEVIAVTALKVLEFSGTLKYAIPSNYLKGLLAGKGDPPPPPQLSEEPKVASTPDESLSTAPPSLLLHERLLQTGIGLYEKSRFKDAIESLESAMNGLHDPEIRANAHLYLGFSKWGLAETESSVNADFREALRYNPDVELPPRIGQNHPVFKPLLESARRELIGTLSISPSPPETEIWVFGGEMKRRLLGSGNISIRLFKGNYAVEGILEGAHKVVAALIKPNNREEISLVMPTEAPPSHEFELTLDLFSAEKPKDVKVHYTLYDASGKQLDRGMKEMQLREHKRESSTWVYHTQLPSAPQGGRIVYRIEADGKVIRDDPVQVEILEPPESALFDINQTISIKARVISNVAVREVRVYYDSPGTLAESSPSQALLSESSSNTYKGEIPVRRNRTDGESWFYVSATPEKGIKARSVTRAVRAKTLSQDTPKIAVLEPPSGAPLPINEPINIKAEVKSSAPLNEVRVYYDFPRKRLSETSPSKTLENKSSSDTYIGEIPKEHNREEGYIWYFVMATTEKGTESKSPDGVIEVKEPTTRMHQGVWASHSWSSYASKDSHFNPDWERKDVASIAYLSEGKGFQTLGAQLDFPYENTVNTSATIQWGPPMKESPMGFAFLGGIAGYRSSEPSSSPTIQSTQITPILGGSLKFYPLDRVVVDLTGLIKLRSENSDADRNSSVTKEYLHHYEMGIRLYISPTLNLKAGYGEWRIGEYNNTSVQVGLGATF